MLIAVNSFPQPGRPASTYHYYTMQLFSRLSIEKPGEEIVFLHEKHHPLLHEPDLWVKQLADASLRTTSPQILVADDLAFPGSFFRKWLVPLKLRRARKIITLSSFLKEKLAEQYPLSREKIAVIPGAPNQLFRPLGWQEKETIKAAYTEGCEYFMVSGGMYDEVHLLNLLKAFSLFKKWQHSNMKLIMTHTAGKQHAGLEEKLKTYKYRKDVLLTGVTTAEKLAQLTAGSYALVHTAAAVASELTMLDAMQAGIPVIAADNNNLPETGIDAVLYAHPNDPDAIAKQMLALYRNENLRSDFIGKGQKRAEQFSWQNATDLFWEQLVL
jgi:glycosyltransferase involved in cell wall biosynthesis